ncbi:MAG: hypothetical protein PVJ57_05865 [Phycisphaerae bacterium]|jgi:hypothetical protein
MTDRGWRTVYGVIRDPLRKRFSVQELRAVLGKAGFDIVALPRDDDRAKIFAKVDAAFEKMSEREKAAALSILAEELTKGDDGLLQESRTALERHGFDYFDGVFSYVELFDERDRPFVPESAIPDLSKALTRLADHDYSGAIGAACGAVDSVTQRIYAAAGRPVPDGFQGKVCSVLKPLWSGLVSRLVDEIGMSQSDAADLVKCLRGSCTSSSNALQIMRRTLGDVHGDKPATAQTAYYAIKSAAALCGMMSEGLLGAHPVPA